MDDKHLRAYLAELIGTFALVFVSAGAVYVNYLGGLQPTSVAAWISIALAAGMIYAAALAFTLPAAGGFLNPAISITLWVFKRLDGGRTIGLVAVQLLGAALAGLALWALLGFRQDILVASHLGAPQFNLDTFGYQPGASTVLPILKGIAVELVMTFLLVFVIFGTLLDPRAKQWAGSWAQRLACLWIGLGLAAATLVAFPLTGAALNPARWFGPAIWDRIMNPNAITYHAVYWVGPIAGALLAGWLYAAFILPPEEEQRGAASASTNATGATAAAGSGLARAKR